MVEYKGRQTSSNIIDIRGNPNDDIGMLIQAAWTESFPTQFDSDTFLVDSFKRARGTGLPVDWTKFKKDK